MNSQLYRILNSKKEQLRKYLAAGRYLLFLSVLDKECTKWMIPATNYDICRITPYNKDVSQMLGIDYINASLINIDEIDYIACQHPKPEYYNLFIDFIIKSDAKLIISLMDDPTYFKNLKLIKIKKVIKNNEIILKDEIYYINKTKIRRITYMKWADHTAIKDEEMEEISKYVEKLEKKIGKDEKRIIVHCRMGVGRTGTYIMYRAIRKLKKINDEEFIDLLVFMRACRPFMVENASQLEYLAGKITDRKKIEKTTDRESEEQTRKQQ